MVVNRCMSLDGFTAGPGDAMDWIFDYMKGGVEEQFPEIMAATGAMLVGGPTRWARGGRQHRAASRATTADPSRPYP